MLYICYVRLENANAAKGSAAVRSLLGNILTRLHLTAEQVEKSPEGRPFLPSKPFLDVSFSHTASLGVCALLDTRPLVGAANLLSLETPYRIGVDAEPITPSRTRDPFAFSRRFFGAHEQAFIANAPNATRALLEIFTAKEAYAKQRGDGLAKHLSKTDTMAPDFCKNQDVCFKRFELADHTITICLTNTLINTDVECIEIELP